MINLALAALVFSLAIASEVLLWIEQKRRATVFGGQISETNTGLVRRIIRPLLAAVLVWVVSSQVEKAAIARQESANSAQFELK